MCRSLSCAAIVIDPESEGLCQTHGGPRGSVLTLEASSNPPRIFLLVNSRPRAEMIVLTESTEYGKSPVDGTDTCVCVYGLKGIDGFVMRCNATMERSESDSAVTRKARKVMCATPRTEPLRHRGSIIYCAPFQTRVLVFEGLPRLLNPI